MFTGIVEPAAVLAPCGPGGGVLTVRPRTPWKDLAAGESVAVNGACLTARACTGDAVSFDVVPESARVTAIGALRGGDIVHVERALRVGDRMGGHYVLGHVDCVGTVAARCVEGADAALDVAFPARFTPFVVPRGSIAVNGVSLTVARAEEGRFRVYLVPYTRRETHLDALRTGGTVNIEFDYFGKWVLRAHGRVAGDLTRALGEAGFLTEDAWNT